MAGCHDTPNSRASWATEWPSRPTLRQISTRARSVSTARGAMASVSSDHVLTAQPGSGQRHRRLCHTSTTRRSPMGRSRTRTTRRPWLTALVPHPSQPTTSAVVSTASHSSRPRPAERRPRTRPCREARWRPHYGASSQGGLPSLLPWSAATMARPLASFVDPYAGSPLTSAPTLHRVEPVKRK